MTDKVFDNNQVTVAGEVVSEFTYSHDVFGEGFYLMEISVNRLSDTYDVIPVMVSERLINVKESCKGKFVEINGQFRSYNRHEDNKNRLVLSVFAREVKVMEHAEGEHKPNYIYLDGFVCKPPVYRKTPLGREIADILLAVNRPYGKSDYIPCIFWGRDASFIANQNVGTQLQLEGRIQSREYQKKATNGDMQTKTAYEVSCKHVRIVEQEAELEVQAQ